MSHIQKNAAASNQDQIQANPNPSPNPEFRLELNGLLKRANPQAAVKVEIKDQDGGAPPALMQKPVIVGTLEARLNKLVLMIEQIEKRNLESKQLVDLHRQRSDIRAELNRQKMRDKILNDTQNAREEFVNFRSAQKRGEALEIPHSLEKLYEMRDNMLMAARNAERNIEEYKRSLEEFAESQISYNQLLLERSKAQLALYEAQIEVKRASAPAPRYSRR
ncbi:MAG: hypothetical protein KBE16_05095 [Alphaproteobacteria bacterium]|nr:hypothetical protein [Alphaproteobacteria bacterium]MBP9877965.1 hypothetical protein [Alphaproteobacteria bacterium]